MSFFQHYSFFTSDCFSETITVDIPNHNIALKILQYYSIENIAKTYWLEIKAFMKIFKFHMSEMFSVRVGSSKDMFKDEKRAVHEPLQRGFICVSDGHLPVQ